MTDAEPADARVEAFCKLDVPGVFNAVVAPTQVWQWDPYDVETIHAGARDVFARLLNRAPLERDRGRVLLLMGEAGSGKTHLMRAFRAATHADRQGYFAYLQLTTTAASYERYILSNLVRSLETPYYPPAVIETGLQRLSAAVLAAVPDVSPEAAEQFRNGLVPTEQVPEIVRQWTRRLVNLPKFADCDEDLLAVMLYLQRNENAVRNKAIKWLRCEDLNAYDRGFIGDLVPRTEPEKAFEMVRALAHLMRVAQDAALVLCVDQLEDVFDQESGVDRFVKVVDLLVGLADAAPNLVALLSCLEDYYKQNVQKLKGSKRDRIENDPPPVRLSSPRTLAEIRQMVARRVNTIYDAAGLPVDESSTFPFTDGHLRPRESLGSRTVLQWLQAHHDQCAIAGRWLEPDVLTPTKPVPEIVADDLDRAWNDAITSAGSVPDAEPELAGILAWAIVHANAELPAEYAAATSVDGNTLSVDRPAGRMLVAVCDKSAQGGGLAKQLTEVSKKAAGRPVVVVRSVPFPVSPKSQVSIQLGRLLGSTGRRVQASDTDWRTMAAFGDFAAKHQSDPGFADWQRRAKPLGQLQTMQVVLDLKSVTEARPQKPAVEPPRKLNPPVEPPASSPAQSAEVKVGVTRELMSSPVFIQPEDIKRHMAFIGGSGSGKTTVALRIIEQLLARSIGAVLVDRKGDLSRYADPAAWDVATDQHPTHGPRRRWLQDHLDIDLFTPGSGDKGRPLTLPIVPDDLSSLSDSDRDESAQFAAESLGGMLKLDPRKDTGASMLAILGKAIEVLAVAGKPVDVDTLRELIGGMDPTLVNAVGGYDSKKYKKLAESLLTLQLRNARLLTGAGGETLDLDRMFGHSARPRLTIINTQSLAADAIDFWVSQFLSAVYRWQARNPSPTLRAVLMLDEADQYLPATRKPATKGPLESLLRRARSAGLGIMLATQQPGDLDYKGRDNILSWLIGLVKETNSINKLKPMFLGSRGDVADKLPTQGVGEFYYVREGQVTSLKAGLSLIRTEQMSLDRVLTLAKDRPPLKGG